MQASIIDTGPGIASEDLPLVFEASLSGAENQRSSNASSRVCTSPNASSKRTKGASGSRRVGQGHNNAFHAAALSKRDLYATSISSAVLQTIDRQNTGR